MNKKLSEIIRIWRRKRDKEKNTAESFHSDVLGSYTGTPELPDDEKPVQDADDL